MYLRASISNECNLNCIYCPTAIGMENQSPNFLKGKKLSVEQYSNNLECFARNGIKAITFTGGEPTLNKHLSKYLSFANKKFDKVEITTNGFKLKNYLESIINNVDILKISLDVVDKISFNKITQKNDDIFNNTIEAIHEACNLGVTVAINVVIMRTNIHQIEKLIKFCRMLNQLYNSDAYVSLLDLYYSSSNRKFWQKNFIPSSQLIKYFTEKYGEPVKQKRFGCQFYWFNVNGVKVRFKNSVAVTQRSEKCNNCKEYCQEGIFSIKHSIEGWVTYCLSENENNGIYLSPKYNDNEADKILKPFLDHINNSKPDPNSFAKLLNIHKLSPKNLNYAIR